MTSFTERLGTLAFEADLDGIAALLDSLNGEELAQAKAWIPSGRRWYTSSRRRADSLGPGALARDVWLVLPWALSLCAVHLCGPVAAAQRIPWGDFWDYRHDPGEILLTRLVCGQSREWAAEFVTAASHVSMTEGDSRRGAGVLSRVLRAIGRHHHLGCPTGAAFYGAWLAGCPEDSILEAVANDPWMPALLDQYLEHGGTDSRVLEAIPQWIEQGTTSRDHLLTTAFTLLATPRRPGSQSMLAKILVLLEFGAAEVPGGLDYLLGTLASVAGPAGRPLLPAAIELVRDPDDLSQLTAVIAARDEKAQRSLLLAALRRTLIGRVGEPAVVAALKVLADTPDIAFAEQVHSVISRLRPDLPVPQQQPSTLGLWALTPTRPAGSGTARLENAAIDWEEYLTEPGSPKDAFRAAAIDELLSTLADGYPARLAYVADLALHLLESGRLVLSRFTNLLPDLFLGGAMREVWPIALRVADAAAGRPGATPPTLADLLRTLARFAPEAPRQELPSGLLELIAGLGKSKAQLEARNLAALLAASQPAGTLTPAKPPQRGLWIATEPAGRLPEARLLAAPNWSNDRLVQVIGFGYCHLLASHHPLAIYPPDHRQLKVAHAWMPEQALTGLVRAINAGRGDGLRARIVDVNRTFEPQSTITAIDLWASGRLDVDLFWRLARQSVTRRQCQDPDRYPSFDNWGTVGELRAFTQTLAQDEVLVLPESLNGAAARLAFLRACECLLLAERNPVVLATPTFQDGTLSLDDLLARLEVAGGAPVGLLDLLQALHRLREVDPGRAGEIPSGRWTTAAELSAAAGGPAADAGQMLRTWVAAGGLPPLVPVRQGHPRWRTTTVGPVPWSVAEAAPRELADNEYYLGDSIDVLRLFPLWPDRSLGRTYYPEERLPCGAHGQFGRPLHARLFELMSDSSPDFDPTQLARLAFQTGRIDPVTAVAAVAEGSVFDLHSPASHARLARGFARVFTTGGLAAAWPTALAIAVHYCRGLGTANGGELLRVLAHFAREVPRPRADGPALDALRSVAERLDCSSLTQGARCLLAALEAE